MKPDRPSIYEQPSSTPAVHTDLPHQPSTPIFHNTSSTYSTQSSTYLSANHNHILPCLLRHSARHPSACCSRPGMAPPVGHTFRCEKSYQVPRASTSIAKWDVGVVDRISADGTLVDITIHNRPGHKVAVPSIPLANLSIGALFISDKQPLPLVFTGPLLSSIRPLPSASSDIENERNPFRKAICYFLSGVWDNQARIPYLNQSHRNLIMTHQNIRTTAQRFLDNVQGVNPRFLETYGKQGTTIDMIIPTLQPTGTHDHDAGIYLVILDQFGKKTSRFGLNPHAYVGKSSDIGRRIKEHNSSADGNSDEGQEVHRVMREAGRHRWFKLASHDVNEGHSAEIGNAMRDVMVTTFMMLFGTMSDRVMVARVRSYDDTAKDIAQNYDRQEMAKVFTDLSVAAFRKAGYFLPSTPNRSQAFGLHRYGCNVTIPLGGESGNVYERTVWVRQDRGNQWTFHRSPLKFPKHKHISSMTFSNDQKGGSLQIQPTKDEIAEMGIETGDEYRLIWEVMKPEAGTHPVAFVRLSEIGCWSNWSYANKVALKIVFYSNRTRTWKTRYLQRQAQHHFVQDCLAPGAHADYSMGVGLYCFFMRCRFPAAQPWMAFFGYARIVTYSVDTFSQTIVVAHFNASADDKLTGPVYSPDVPRIQMERLGLQNVNGTWRGSQRGFDWSWLTDPAKWKDGKVGAPNYAKSFKSRQKCDFCLFSANVSLTSVAFKRARLTCSNSQYTPRYIVIPTNANRSLAVTSVSLVLRWEDRVLGQMCQPFLASTIGKRKFKKWKAEKRRDRSGRKAIFTKPWSKP